MTMIFLKSRNRARAECKVPDATPASRARGPIACGSAACSRAGARLPPGSRPSCSASRSWPRRCSGVDQVRLKLPLKPRLPLRGNEKIALAPFLIVTDAERARDKRLQNVDLQGEFHRFLKKQIEKKTKLEIVETPPELKLPTQNLTELGRATEFWRSVGASTGAEIVVSGSLEFRVEDRSGYKTEEYVSPINGQTYYRQVYVEQTGFLFDIVFLVFDGRSGEKIPPGPVQGLPPDRQPPVGRAAGPLREPLLAGEPDPEPLRRARARSGPLPLHELN